MLSLIIKDFLNMKKALLIYLLLLGVYVFVFAFTGDLSVILGVLMIISVMTVISAMGFDEKYKWNVYELALPISRKTIVIEKYVLGILFFIISFVISFAFSYIMSFFKEVDVYENINAASLLTIIGVVMLSILLPLLFKYGVEKGRILLIAVLALPTVFIMVFQSYITEERVELAIKFLPLIAIALMVISIMISIKIYNKKEF